ncbi:cytochrome c family protein [Syntrophobacter fumaroxidans MPOB]|uniref:Cytochrome c family protein n=2 Tax=Syntrophobacter TaxID=29526 RepID=A0LNA9_SYNFM|nr:cytochrome c family protein [Syntrophobacter fumaroxidans MPOB]
MRMVSKSIVWFLIVAGGAALFAWQGWYNVAANVPHWDATVTAIELIRDRSIEAHSRGISVPALDDARLVSDGARTYDEVCRYCHGAPGVPSAVFAQGLYPAPANLASDAFRRDFKEARVFWVIKNGIKMTGMPAFGSFFEDVELWAAVAFVKRLPGIGAEEYRSMTAKTDKAGP